MSFNCLPQSFSSNNLEGVIVDLPMRIIVVHNLARPFHFDHSKWNLRVLHDDPDSWSKLKDAKFHTSFYSCFQTSNLDHFVHHSFHIAGNLLFVPKSNTSSSFNVTSVQM